MSGSDYVRELLESNERRIQEVLRMPRSTFIELCELMKKKNFLKIQRVSIEEQLAIFLHIVGGNCSNRSAQERFQHSGETISR